MEDGRIKQRRVPCSRRPSALVHKKDDMSRSIEKRYKETLLLSATIRAHVKLRSDKKRKRGLSQSSSLNNYIHLSLSPPPTEEERNELQQPKELSPPQDEELREMTDVSTGSLSHPPKSARPPESRALPRGGTNGDGGDCEGFEKQHRVV